MPEWEAEPPPPTTNRRRRRFREATPVLPSLPDEVILEHILTRVPAAAAVRSRAVCRAWRAALTSDHFAEAHRAARAAVAGCHPPEIVFFAPTAAARSTTTIFYSCRLDQLTPQQNGSSDYSAPARALAAVADVRAGDLVLSGTRPCRGLTLLFQPGECAYHVCNLSTGELVSLPPRAWAHRAHRSIPYGPFVFSSAGLGFHPAAGEHRVVRLFEDWSKRQRCEVYGLRSGGWRPCAGRPPPNAAKGLDGRPPVFADGCFYWYMNTGKNFYGARAKLFGTPEPILSLSVDTEQFAWVRPPEERVGWPLHLAELDRSLCAVLDWRPVVERERYEIWTRTSSAAGSTPPAWSLRCRICLASLPQPMRGDLARGCHMLPLGSSFGGRILLATSGHEVFAYDPESGAVDRVFSMRDWVGAVPGEAALLLNIALHEESVTGVGPVAGDEGGKLKMRKLGSSAIVARRGGPAAARRQQHRDDGVAAMPQLLKPMFSSSGVTMALFPKIVNMHN